MMLTGREIVLGVTGGIAAYKSAEIVSRLRRLGASVHVIMTKSATEFVTPLTFETIVACVAAAGIRLIIVVDRKK